MTGNILTVKEYMAAQGFIPSENGADQFCTAGTDYTCNSENFSRIKIE